MPAVYLDSSQTQHGYSALTHKNDVVIVFSRGGETVDIIHVLEIARTEGASTIAIGENDQSTIA
jgi:D-arabinose 5-phosphate isomerase GutQ